MAFKDNLTGVQFESVRRKVDAGFLALVKELEVAYYQNWKLGLSYSFYGRDPIKEGIDPKALFDALHGNIWNEHSKAIIQQNEADGRPYPAEKVNPVDAQGISKLGALQVKLEQDLNKGFGLTTEMKSVISGRRDQLAK